MFVCTLAFKVYNPGYLPKNKEYLPKNKEYHRDTTEPKSHESGVWASV